MGGDRGQRLAAGGVLTFVLCGGKGERLFPLTRDRSKPAVPFGGSYRIIDFALSNCINSELRKIYLLTQYKSHSLERHAAQGWNLFSPELGEFVHTIPPQLRIGTDWYLGTADAIFQNLYSIEAVSPDHVLILSGDHVYNMDYREMLARHVSSGADATLAVVPVAAREASRFGIVQLDAERRVVGFKEKPTDVDPDGEDLLGNMGVYMFRRDSLEKALTIDAARAASRRDFGHDVLPYCVEEGGRVVAHEFRSPGSEGGSYWRDIGTLDAYYRANMELVSVTPPFNLYDQDWPVRTRPVQAPPAKFVFADDESGRVGSARDTIVSPGVIVSGGSVRNSVLGPGCRVNSWSEVRASILLGDCEIGRRAVVERAILDKEVTVAPGARLVGGDEADAKRFTVTDEGVAVVPRGTRIE